MFLADYNLHQYFSKMYTFVRQIHNTFITKATNDHTYIFEMRNNFVWSTASGRSNKNRNNDKTILI